MSYSVKLYSKVEKFLKRCPLPVQIRIKKKLKSLKKEPFRYLEHYEEQDFFKLRIREYRALIDVDMKRKIIFVRVIDHRSRIYKRN